MHEVLDSWLGKPRWKLSEGRVTLNYGLVRGPKRSPLTAREAQEPSAFVPWSCGTWIWTTRSARTAGSRLDPDQRTATRARSSTFVAVRAAEPDEPLPPPPSYRDKWVDADERRAQA
jgi:hypothetical protein